MAYRRIFPIIGAVDTLIPIDSYEREQLDKTLEKLQRESVNEPKEEITRDTSSLQ